MLRRLSLTLKDQKDVNRALCESRGAAVPYHEPTSTDDDDDDVDDDVSPQSLHDVISSMSARAEVPSWPSTPSTPNSLPSTMSSAGETMSPPPLELSARTLLWSGSVSSPPGSLSPPAVYLPQSGGVGFNGLQLLQDKQLQSLAALAETGDVDGLKAALKVDANSVNQTDQVGLFT